MTWCFDIEDIFFLLLNTFSVIGTQNKQGLTYWLSAVKITRCWSWFLDSRALAKKVINAGQPDAYQIKDCEANTRCPNCQHQIYNTDISHEWPGLPAGVRFDPSDVELLEHLAAKRGVGKSDSHIFIDEFIPTLEDKEGICCTHPEKLPGAKKDGSTVHFFYRITNAYSSGTRKRRRIQNPDSTIKSIVRWHKTGKTKPVMENGILKGFKKIMVLKGTPKTGWKPEKCNWVMHQYHLGPDEIEKQGEYVVSKITYQPRKAAETIENPTWVKEELDTNTVQVIPMTPNTTTPDLPPQDKTPYSDCLSEDYLLQSFLQETERIKGPPHDPYSSRLDDDEYATCLGSNSKAVDLNRVEYLLCNEIIESYADDFSTQANFDSSLHDRDGNASCGIGDLYNLELDTPPDFQNLQFDSQDSVFDSLDRL